MTALKATAIANSNIALVKYWGKRDERLLLPANSSISVTLDDLYTTTTVEFGGKRRADRIQLDGRELLGEERTRVVRHLDLVRKLAGIKGKARVESKNNFPTAAGLASSASGFCALSLAASAAAGMGLDARNLSILSRLGSGSASRSVYGGFVEWVKGHQRDGSDSCAVQLADETHWKDFRLVTTIVTSTKKKISSRAGMRETVKTSPLYKTWLETIDPDLKAIRKGIRQRNLTQVGEIAEVNCLKMHATMMTTTPRVLYWQPATMEVIRSVVDWRASGERCWFTIDGGPNVKVLCRAKDARRLARKLEGLKGVKKAIVCKPGQGARLSFKHLF